MEADPEAELLRGAIRALGGGHATLMRASDAVRATVPAFEPRPTAEAILSARIREKLDPAGIFNLARWEGPSEPCKHPSRPSSWLIRMWRNQKNPAQMCALRLLHRHLSHLCHAWQ